MNDERHKTKFVLADQFIVSGSNFVTGLLLARFLGPEGYGQFILTYNIILFVSGIQIALITAPMMVIGASLRDKESKEYYAVVILQQLLFCLVFGVLLLGGVGIMSRFWPEWGLEDLLWPLIFALSAFICQDFFRRYLFVHDRAGAALVNDLISHSLKFALLAGLGLTLGVDAKTVLWVIGIASVVGILAAVLFQGHQSIALPRYANLSGVTSEHWDFGKWLLANNIVYWSSSQLVIYIAGGVISLAAVGSISAALNVVGTANILFLALENVVPTRAARIYALRGEDELNRYLRRVVVLGGGGTLGIVAIAGFWSEFWLKLFYGTAYQGDGWIVVWWGAFYFLGFFQRPLSAGLRALGNTRGIFFASLGGALVAMIIGYPAIRWAGMPGVMLSLCLVQIAVLSTMVVSYKRTTGVLSNNKIAANALVLPTGMKEMP